MDIWMMISRIISICGIFIMLVIVLTLIKDIITRESDSK